MKKSAVISIIVAAIILLLQLTAYATEAQEGEPTVEYIKSYTEEGVKPRRYI